MYCSVCGAKMAEDMRFCGKCGAKLVAKTVPNKAEVRPESTGAKKQVVPPAAIQKPESAWQILKAESPKTTASVQVSVKPNTSKGTVGFVIAAICAVILLVALVSGSSSLIGSWTRVEREGEATPDFTFYSDGTCKLRGEYGLGKWKKVDGKLRITTYYGEVYIFNYDINGDEMTLSRGSQKTTYMKTGDTSGSDGGSAALILLSVIGLLGGGLYGAVMRWGVSRDEDNGSSQVVITQQ